MYHVDCECQQQIEVHGGQAGSNVTCPCGRELRVPSLSDLRASAGQGRFESGVTSKIERMVSTGELPHGSECVVSGVPTDDYVEIQVLCARFTAQEDDWCGDPDIDNFPIALGPLHILIGLWGLFYRMAIALEHWISESLSQPAEPDASAMDPLNPEVVVVLCPLRILASYHDDAARAGSRKLKHWLMTVSVYAELFDLYPQAQCRFLKSVEA